MQILWEWILEHLAWHRAGRWLAFAVVLLAVTTGIVLWWQSRPPAGLLATLPVSEPNLSRVHYSRDGNFLAVGAASGWVYLWGVPQSQPIPLFRVTQQQITALETTHDGFLLATSMSQRALFIWELKSRKALSIRPPPDPVACIAAHPKRQELAAGLSSGKLYLLNTATGKPSLKDAGHEGGIKTLIYDAAGSMLVSGGTYGAVIAHDAKSGEDETRFKGLDGEVGGLAFSSDGKLLAAGDWNGAIRVWKYPDAETAHKLSQSDAVAGIAFTDKYLVTGGWDGQLRFWSLDDEREAAAYRTGAAIHSLALSKDRQTVATVSSAPEVKLWRVPE